MVAVLGTDQTTRDTPAAARRRELDEWVHAFVRPVADAGAVIVIEATGTIRELWASHVDPMRVGATRTAAVALATCARPAMQRLLASEQPFLLRADDDTVTDAALGEVLAALGAREVVCARLPRHDCGLVMLASVRPGRWRATDLPMLRALARATGTIVDPEPPPDAEELLAEVHHDLGNPLHAVALNLELLASLPENDRRARRATIAQLQQTTRRMSELLGELGEYLHPHNVTEPPRPTRVRAAIDDVMTTLAPIAAERSMRLEVVGCDAVVAISARELFRVLSNLVGNAIKYADAGTPVCIRSTVEGRRARISVDDRGPGIAADDCAHVFDREWLAHSRMRRGTGLGLSIARRIVEARGGAITAASQVGYGSRFTVALPLHPGGEAR